MATPIPFSVANSVRVGNFQTANMTMPSGYTNLQWSLSIPNTSEYENTSNAFTSEIHAIPSGGSDSIYGSAGWTGGRFVNKQGQTNPSPQIGFDVSNIVPGTTVYVKMNIANSMTIGIANGVLS